MNYEDFSDEGLSIKVARSAEIKVCDGTYQHFGSCHSFQAAGGRCVTFDINNPADMWPIIELIWDELNDVSPGDDITEWDLCINKYGCGKLRAAAIVFLKMQDSKAND